ncbi:hypothetical protein E4U44_006565 [Claviceps purpurea]|nr:hypothetical protein E4U44_006565 [Claviceps purpurea]
MLAEAEAEDKAKNPTPDVDEAHFSRARGGRRPQVEQRGTRRFTRYGNPQRVTGSSAFCVASLTTLFQYVLHSSLPSACMTSIWLDTRPRIRLAQSAAFT